MDTPSNNTQGTWTQLANGWRITLSTRSDWAGFYLAFQALWTGLLFSVRLPVHWWPINFWQGWLVNAFFFLFMMVGLLFWWITALFYAGRYEFELHDTTATIRLRVGFVGFQRQFNWLDIHAIEECENYFNRYYFGFSDKRILLSGKKRIKFGRLLTHERRIWLMNMLAERLTVRP